MFTIPLPQLSPSQVVLPPTPSSPKSQLKCQLGAVEVEKPARRLRPCSIVDVAQQASDRLLERIGGLGHTEQLGCGISVVCLYEPWVHHPRGEPRVLEVRTANQIVQRRLADAVAAHLGWDGWLHINDRPGIGADRQELRDALTLAVGRSFEKRANCLEQRDVREGVDLEQIAQFLQVDVFDVG